MLSIRFRQCHNISSCIFHHNYLIEHKKTNFKTDNANAWTKSIGAEMSGGLPQLLVGDLAIRQQRQTVHGQNDQQMRPELMLQQQQRRSSADASRQNTNSAAHNNINIPLKQQQMRQQPNMPDLLECQACGQMITDVVRRCAKLSKTNFSLFADFASIGCLFPSPLLPLLKMCKMLGWSAFCRGARWGSHLHGRL